MSQRKAAHNKHLYTRQLKIVADLASIEDQEIAKFNLDILNFQLLSVFQIVYDASR